jgi:hypothetical protein
MTEAESKRLTTLVRHSVSWRQIQVREPSMTRQESHFQLVLLLLGVASLLVVAAAPGQTKEEVHVLWIGNSLTYYNNMPKMVAELARAGGQRPMVHEQETPGGCTLEKHWKDGKAMKKLRARQWDFVVLQEHSQEPLKDSGSMFEYARKFDGEIHKQGGETLLYLTFPRAKAPENQDKLTKLHEDLAAKLTARVVPVGPAWAKAQAGSAPPDLFIKDGVHPNRTGSYLAACVFYAAIYGKSPEGLPGAIGGLSDQEARRFQAIAWQVVKDCSARLEVAVGSITCPDHRAVGRASNADAKLASAADGRPHGCNKRLCLPGAAAAERSCCVSPSRPMGAKGGIRHGCAGS